MITLSRPIVELTLAAATALAVLTVAGFTDGGASLAGASPLAAALALLVPLRRRWPVAVLLASVACVIAMRTAGLTEIGWLWPASVAYFTAATTRRGLAWAVGVGGFELCFAAAWLGSVEHTRPTFVGVEALWLLAVLALGLAWRNRRLWRREQERRLDQLAREYELRSRNRAAEERLHIARELHDVIGHTLTAVGVQLRVATEALDDSPAEAAQTLHTAQRVRTEAFNDLRALVTALRTGEDTATDPHVDAATLNRLAAPARDVGLSVTVTVDGDPARLPSAIGLAVHRVVSESLTNIVRHAEAGTVTVRLDCEPARAVVTVADDGNARAVPEFGNGLSGLRERVAALDGELTVTTTDPGLTVRAVVPVPRSRP